MGLSFFSLSFSITAIKKYKLTLTELVVLDWLRCWMSTQLESKDRKNEGVFYWVDYQKIIEELSWIRMDHPYSIASMRILFQKLFAKGILIRWRTSVEGKPRVYCRFNNLIARELTGHNEDPDKDQA